MYIEAICKNQAKEFNLQHAMTAHAMGNIDSSQFMKVINQK